ncbi:hypothetical protein Poli38472_005542 [Pythium oligandrum]|uniref:HMG box domain-containing protein n=1 Tax=Pythium oligandrum TaxID=41045 RepID=A0A8K1FJA6_PYTOL|nr:hypothetical protein Poli38472_005542 [Pythium oligandrum]|eukprot:TMW62924.1 hypothetical protein Poli38472_005542 [Pythium oligandrum]
MSGSHAHGGVSTLGLAPLTPAERLVRLMQRQALSPDQVAGQLGWSLEQLQTYLAPENRQQTQRWLTATPEMENAVEKLLMRQDLRLAAGIVKRANKTIFAQANERMRQAHAAPQLARMLVGHRRSVLQPVAAAASRPPSPFPAEKTEGASPPAANRKRKRKAVVKPLSSFPSPCVVKVASDLLCPVRIDVDVDGVRYQDTLLVNNAVPNVSPEVIATRIAREENLSDLVKDAIAESIRRQLVTFASFIDPTSESLHPITLDLVIDGYSLRDQFEWDVYSDLNNAEAFASTLCADLNLPRKFEAAIAFSIREQVYAYRKILHSKRWIANDPMVQKNGTPAPEFGIATLDPIEDNIFRENEDTVLWQPVLSELAKDEVLYLTTRTSAHQRPTSMKKPVMVPTNGRIAKRSPKFVPKENKAPRPINPFIMYCQLQKDIFLKSKLRRSAAETRKILGDMWRKCTDEEKEKYAQLTEIENEKRRREHVFDMRDRGISDWEEDESRRLGLLGSSVLEATTEHIRGLLLANYMHDRHEVDVRREAPAVEDAEEDEDEEES